MITIRKPSLLDTPDMAVILNEIIQSGGATAMVGTLTAQNMADIMASNAARSAWHVAMDAKDQLVGYQWITPSDDLPPTAADISTFVKIGQTQLGIGSKLFEATQAAAKDLGYAWISANIRADNEGGLIYYQSRGFEDYGQIKDYKMRDGQLVDKRLKRFDL